MSVEVKTTIEKRISELQEKFCELLGDVLDSEVFRTFSSAYPNPLLQLRLLFDDDDEFEGNIEYLLAFLECEVGIGDGLGDLGSQFQDMRNAIEEIDILRKVLNYLPELKEGKE